MQLQNNILVFFFLYFHQVRNMNSRQDTQMVKVTGIGGGVLATVRLWLVRWVIGRGLGKPFTSSPLFHMSPSFTC
jgi:hypothetical protein